MKLGPYPSDTDLQKCLFNTDSWVHVLWLSSGFCQKVLVSLKGLGQKPESEFVEDTIVLLATSLNADHSGLPLPESSLKNPVHILFEYFVVNLIFAASDGLIGFSCYSYFLSVLDLQRSTILFHLHNHLFLTTYFCLSAILAPITEVTLHVALVHSEHFVFYFGLHGEVKSGLIRFPVWKVSIQALS